MESFKYNSDLLFEAIYKGRISLSNLPVNLYKKTAKFLNKAVTGPADDLTKNFHYSIYVFSAAKTATQVADISSMANGVSLAEFKKAAATRFHTYNTDWLESEFITAQTAASNAANYKYTQDNKEIFPRLKSVAIIDQYTAPECYRMNNVIADVDDPIWNHNLAPRHFRCRCHEERLDRYDSTNSTTTGKLRYIQAENDKEMSDLFKFNPAKEQVIFSKKHPYYEIGKEHPALAKQNWGLPIP